MKNKSCPLKVMRFVGLPREKAARPSSVKLLMLIKIPLDQVVAVGNGIDDIEMLSKSGLGIVFQSKGKYKSFIGGSIVQMNLKSILYMLGASEEEFT